MYRYELPVKGGKFIQIEIVKCPHEYPVSLSQHHLAKIKAGFPAGDVADVIAELGRISTSETMDSQGNLDNAIGAILELAARR